jgi:hypothetical protein
MCILMLGADEPPPGVADDAPPPGAGGLLGTADGNFNPIAPSPTGAPLPPPASRGASGSVIR